MRVSYKNTPFMECFFKKEGKENTEIGALVIGAKVVVSRVLEIIPDLNNNLLCRDPVAACIFFTF